MFKNILFVFIFCNPIYSVELITLLSGYEWKLKEKFFLNREEDTAQKLMDISLNQQLKYHIRVRAIMALRLFNEERVKLFLEKQIDQKLKSSNLLRHLLSLEKITQKDKDRYTRSAKKHIFNQEDQVRLSVARSLKRINTRSSRSLLKVQANRESNPKIKNYIENGRIY
ncbi:hypothetical protein MJH12_02895 [bacterium]|nr:hypothetical protein [bacterium]